MQADTTTEYRIRDKDGALVAIHEHVKNLKTGGKQCFWHRPDGETGLNGTRLEDLPLYGVHELDDKAMLTVVTEGEKARDALLDALKGTGVNVVGTVCGASVTPSREVLEDLRDQEVVLWADADLPGRKHMARVGERLQGIAAMVRLYNWPEAKEKGDDAADHPAVKSGDEEALDRLLNDLCGAPAYTLPDLDANGSTEAGFGDNKLLRDRVLLGKGLAEGIEPPEELESGVLLKGKVHQVYAGPGSGKTMFALYLIARCIKRGQTAVFFDMENGLRITSERLRDLGVDPAKVDEHLVYLPAPNLPLASETKAAYVALLEEVKPELIVFDSWINFLASAGLSENESVDIAKWAVAYTHPARNRGICVVLLDHVPHDNSHARGSTRKKDEVDVQWKLHCTKPFDRDSVGEIVLHREKDREGWLPPSVRYSVGGGKDGFVFSRSAGTTEETGEGDLTERQKQALDALKVFGDKGARYSEWQRTSGLKGTTFDRSISALSGRGLIAKADGRYFPRTNPEPPEPPGVKTGLFKPNEGNPHEPPSNPHAPNGGSGANNPHYPHRLKGGGNGGNSGGSSEKEVGTKEQQAEIDRLVYEGMSPKLARAEVLGDSEAGRL
jgi:AAA domain